VRLELEWVLLPFLRERDEENERVFQSNYWTPFDHGALLTFHNLFVCRSR
jgi:hypothetical protein